MAIINVALSDTFDTWRTKTNTLGTNQGDLANLDASFAATDLVSALNEIKAGNDLTQLKLGDSTGLTVNRIRLGDSDDLQIYHDGTHSRISDQGTGHLVLEASRLQVNNAAGNEAMIVADQDSSVVLYHDNSTKLTTTSTGVEVTGEVDMDTLKMPDNTAGKVLVGDGTSYEEVAVSGDATLASNGALTIANDAVTNAMIATDAVNADSIAAGAVGASEIADGTITSTEFNNVVTLIIYDSSGSAVKTLRTPGS